MDSQPTPPNPASASVVPPDDPLRTENLRRTVMQACDILFGMTALTMFALGIWLYLLGQARFLTVAALCSLPVVNLVWSITTKYVRGVAADLARAAISLPIATYLYVAEHGVLDRLWIPALLMCLGLGLTLGLSARSSLTGCAVAFVYGASLFGAAWHQLGHCDLAALDDGFGLWLIGCVTSVVANKLTATVEEARRQRDAAHEQKDRAEAVMRQLTERSRELTTAIDNLHTEMAARTRIELELRQAQKLESVGRLAAGVAHEINTPVQFVSDSLQFVRDGMSDLFVVVDRLEAVQQSVLRGTQALEVATIAATATAGVDLPYLVEHLPKAVDRALEGLDRVATIVRSMKEFAHPDSKAMADADINHAIESTLTIARNEYKYVAELETELGELPRVRCYVGELNQAVLNIVVNAAHAIGDVVRGTGEKGRIYVRTYRDNNDAVIEIGDTGGGIPEHVRERIFDPFYTTKEVGRGTGQGLAIARSVIVDKHHGRLDFETEVGVGTTFLIRVAIDGAPAAMSAAVA